jgi:glycosyltransferase involved in cell wall biosynthesis
VVGAQHPIDDDRMVYREALELSKLYNVEVLGVGPSKKTYNHGRLKMTCFRKRAKLTHMILLVQIYLYLRSRQFDIIHCFDLDSLFLAVLISRLSRKGPSIVYDAHEHFPSLLTYYFTLPATLSKSLQFVVDRLELLLASFCAAFVEVNEPLRRRFAVFHRPNAVVRNVASISWYDHAKSYHVLQDLRHPIVLFVGFLDWKKGLDTTIRAKMVLDKLGVKTHFVIVGIVKGATRYADLEQIGIRFTGSVNYLDIPSYLRRASIGLALILPININYSIAQPAKVFHYMVAGLPVVASDIPGIRQIVAEEDCGVLVDPDSPYETANAIARLLKDDDARKSMGKNARKAAEREYNWEMESEKLLRLYRELEGKRIAFRK